jgi:parallel beta-helix repeat protein
VDGAGNLYISDLNNNRVRKVDTHGTITTYAGNGNSGGGHDGVPATSSVITWPSGLAIGPGGVLTIAESGFARVREVNAQGIISTIAGNGIPGYSGDGGPGTSATLDSPTAVAYDGAGNLLIADDFNGVIRSVAAGTPPPPPPVTKKTANCGITVTQNLTLADDIGPCPGDGVIIGADGVHLNLNGHTISGNFSHGGNSAGVRATGPQKLDISNGTITGFDAGVALITGGGNTVRGLTVANNVGNMANTFNSTFGDGILMFSSGGNTVAGNVVAGNGPFDGIAMIGFGADNNLIQNNTVTDTPNANRPNFPGLGLGITTNPFLGFDRPRTVSLYGNEVIGNVVSNNASAGISTVSNIGGVIRSNIAKHNGFGSPFGFAYPGNGIGVTHLFRADPHTNTIVENNQAIGNAMDGIDISGLGNQILNNVADGNGGRFAGRFRFDLTDENRDPNNNNLRDCYADTWSGNRWGSGGHSPACTGNGGSPLADGSSGPERRDQRLRGGIHRSAERWRPGHAGVAPPADVGRRRQSRQPVHRGHRAQPRTQGGRGDGDHHDVRGRRLLRQHARQLHRWLQR